VQPLPLRLLSKKLRESGCTELLPRDDPSLARMRGLLDAARERPAFQTTSQEPEFYIKSYKGYGQEKAATKLEIEAVPASGTSARL